MTILLLLLAGMGAAPEKPARPNWLEDYGAALREAKVERVPLLVVLENSREGASQLEQSAEFVEQPADLLNHYKLCRVDVGTKYGQQVAQAFKAEKFPTTVIIDKTASVQIFKKSGKLNAKQWRTTLASYKHGRRASHSEVNWRWLRSGTCPNCR